MPIGFGADYCPHRRQYRDRRRLLMLCGSSWLGRIKLDRSTPLGRHGGLDGVVWCSRPAPAEERGCDPANSRSLSLPVEAPCPVVFRRSCAAQGHGMGGNASVGISRLTDYSQQGWGGGREDRGNSSLPSSRWDVNHSETPTRLLGGGYAYQTW